MFLVRSLFLLLALAASPALAQTNPGFTDGPPPLSAGQLNFWFSIKQDVTSLRGSPPPNTGACAITSQVGGNTGGQFATGGADCMGDGAFVFTFTTNAPIGWACFINDLTRFTAAVVQTASTVNTVTFHSTSSAGEYLNFACTPY